MLLVCREDVRIKAARNIIRQTMWNRRQLLREDCAERNRPVKWSRSPIKLKAQYEDTLAGVDAECRELREKSRVEAKNEYSRIIDQADAKSVKMIKDAEKTIEIKQNKALSDMQSQIAELAMAAAGKIVGGEGDAASAGSAMYDDFLNEVNKAGDSGDAEGN